MTTICQAAGSAAALDKDFVGTIAFVSEEFCLPDGSKMALGIDDGHWVLVYQQTAHARFQAFAFDQKENKITVDEKTGGQAEIKVFKKLVKYFLENARVDELVTLLPPQ